MEIMEIMVRSNLLLVSLRSILYALVAIVATWAYQCTRWRGSVFIYARNFFVPLLRVTRREIVWALLHTLNNAVLA